VYEDRNKRLTNFCGAGYALLDITVSLNGVKGVLKSSRVTRTVEVIWDSSAGPNPDSMTIQYISEQVSDLLTDYWQSVMENSDGD